MKKLKLKISGMHCGSCERIIQMNLSDINGVIDSHIDAKTGQGLVTVSDTVSDDLIISTIKDTGYHAQLTG